MGVRLSLWISQRETNRRTETRCCLSFIFGGASKSSKKTCHALPPSSLTRAMLLANFERAAQGAQLMALAAAVPLASFSAESPHGTG